MIFQVFNKLYASGGELNNHIGVFKYKRTNVFLRVRMHLTKSYRSEVLHLFLFSATLLKRQEEKLAQNLKLEVFKLNILAKTPLFVAISSL